MAVAQLVHSKTIFHYVDDKVSTLTWPVFHEPQD